MITRKRKWIVGITTLLFATVAAAQFFGIPRRVFAMIITDTLLVEGIATFNGVFTGTDRAISISDAIPSISFTETDVTVDNNFWDIVVQSEQLRHRALTDAGAATNYIEIDRTGNTVDTFNLLATTIQNNGVDATHANGTFTITFANGCTTTPSVTAEWHRAGNIVSLFVPGFTCTSDVNSLFSGAEIPTVIRPTALMAVPAWVEDNGTWLVGCAEARSDGIFEIGGTTGGAGIGGCVAASWVTSGDKSWGGNTVTYFLN